MSIEILLLIAGMGIVTYLPRVIPFLWLGNKTLPRWLENVLQNVPYAALGALIFPGILWVHDNVLFGLLGGAVAFFFAYRGSHMIVVVFSAIFALLLLNLFVEPFF
ncbi:AzlD domain-containing protein [Salsuginibacillus kocurii]|uniref:AzlD domain-containing protein n=1 Tax=Salsuginibacillus kocurii TaxID=427078 RepID=UPI0003743AD5|nr:AzlD domain-containing protein [Salsuginibacillus kocurii]